MFGENTSDSQIIWQMKMPVKLIAVGDGQSYVSMQNTDTGLAPLLHCPVMGQMRQLTGGPANKRPCRLVAPMDYWTRAVNFAPAKFTSS